MKRLFGGIRAQIVLWLWLIIAIFGLVSAVHAQPDYPPAIWNPAAPGHWYTTGNGHTLIVIHDMEGYYEANLSYFALSGTQVSCHYAVNSLQNGSDSNGHHENNPGDAPAGEISQIVREQYYAWHALCLNRYSLATEHEGFVVNPVWYTEAMYQASAGLQRHFCDKFNIPIDRNHIFGHGEWQNPAWVAWMSTNYPSIDPFCNNHTDPGQYWDWNHFMDLIIAAGAPLIITQPTNQTVIEGDTVTITVVATNNPTSYQWLFNGTNSIAGGTNATLIITNVPLTAAGFYSVIVSNTNSSITSSNALLTVTPFITISNVAAVPRERNAIITWNTSTNSTSQVAYGLTADLGSMSAVDTNLVTTHGVILTGLSTNNLYYFQVISTSSGRRAVSAIGSFSTDVSLILTAGDASYSGVWTVASAAPDRYSDAYKYAATTGGFGTAQAVFRPTIVTPGQYDVYIWYSQGTNRSQGAPVTGIFQGSSSDSFVDETTNGGGWRLLAGARYFAAGTNGFVRMGNGTGESGKVVIADAVRWVYTHGQDSPATGSVPDWWANFYFNTNVSGALDADGDGYSNYGEYVLGTSPADGNSHFKVTAAPLNPGIQVIFSPWQGGRIYQLQSSPTLTNPVWTTIPGLAASQNTNGDGIITYTNIGTPNPLYRLSVTMAP